MTRLFVTLFALILALPALAQDTAETPEVDEKVVSCGYQSDVVAAVQQARLERIAERDVPEHVLAQSPAWPEKYNNVIPLITPWVYEQKRKIIRNEDLGAAWSELCLQQ
ncbi:hypothetical protein [uncultured Tateyamaria sp.]|uniref:hypothetical protein n=1 Tax=uncultured Tateyamaria sp. TaxID=455651 RepID=UPI00261F5713|nr:hypothetical protein [uncultured Tateyamaria sp.]